MSAVEFAGWLTRKGVYLFNIQDIRKYAEQFDNQTETDKLN